MTISSGGDGASQGWEPQQYKDDFIYRSFYIDAPGAVAVAIPLQYFDRAMVLDHVYYSHKVAAVVDDATGETLQLTKADSGTAGTAGTGVTTAASVVTPAANTTSELTVTRTQNIIAAGEILYAYFLPVGGAMTSGPTGVLITCRFRTKQS